MPADRIRVADVRPVRSGGGRHRHRRRASCTRGARRAGGHARQPWRTRRIPRRSHALRGVRGAVRRRARSPTVNRRGPGPTGPRRERQPVWLLLAGRPRRPWPKLEALGPRPGGTSCVCPRSRSCSGRRRCSRSRSCGRWPGIVNERRGRCSGRRTRASSDGVGVLGARRLRACGRWRGAGAPVDLCRELVGLRRPDSCAALPPAW